jgi:hypothetical protein
MSAKPIDPNSPFQRLRRDSYEVEVRNQHLLVHQVPYVAAHRSIKHGTLVCTYVESAGVLQAPDNHQVWFAGEFPCFADGQPLKALTSLFNESNRRELFEGCWVQHQFSNKPDGCSAFTDHYSKMVHYITLISDQAKAINPFAEARTGKVIETLPEESVFRYPDTASVRYEISAISARLAIKKIAIIGLGGTGGYVLDLVAKTPVQEIHLFDGDEFLQHNAFRAPGAATLEELAERLPKTEYFFRRYDPMRRGIISHPYRIDDTNLSELNDFDFIFVCLDKGLARALICNYLQSWNIKFIDVGMGLEIVRETQKIIGTCRATLSTDLQKDHFARYVPMTDDDADHLYQSNLQVADMNALNAVLAVMKWKQVFGFYSDDFESHHQTFSVSTFSLTRDVIKVPEE